MSSPAFLRVGRAPFVGRGRELAVLAHSLEEARAAHAGIVLLAGEPGIGKTRLLEEFPGPTLAAGVTVLRGVAGYGSSSVYHTDKLLRLSQDLPIILEVIETQERIEQILPRLDEMVDGGLITLEKVRVILYRPAKR